MIEAFPDLHLEDKVNFKEGGLDTSRELGETTSPHMLILILTELPTWLLEGGGRSFSFGGRERGRCREGFRFLGRILVFGRKEPDSYKAGPWEEGHHHLVAFEFNNTQCFLFISLFLSGYLSAFLSVSGTTKECLYLIC